MEDKRERDQWMEKITKALQSFRVAGLRKARQAGPGDDVRESSETERG
jgi:hypothetical protein